MESSVLWVGIPPRTAEEKGSSPGCSSVVAFALPEPH